jgi:hypothetical protein
MASNDVLLIDTPRAGVRRVTTTEPSLAYRRGFERDGGSVREQLSRRGAPFQDYRERGTEDRP